MVTLFDRLSPFPSIELHLQSVSPLPGAPAALDAPPYTRLAAMAPRRRSRAQQAAAGGAAALKITDLPDSVLVQALVFLDLRERCVARPMIPLPGSY